VPIRPENKHRYPKDWPQVRARILARAKNRCEWCGVPNHSWGWRDHTGKFRRVGKRPLIEAGCKRPPFKIATADVGVIKIVEIVLTIAHVHDPSPENCADDNLAALCQKCHLDHDRKHHAAMRVQNRVERDAKSGQLLLGVLTPQDRFEPSALAVPRAMDAQLDDDHPHRAARRSSAEDDRPEDQLVARHEPKG
jgi:hypothetical protein